MDEFVSGYLIGVSALPLNRQKFCFNLLSPCYKPLIFQACQLFFRVMLKDLFRKKIPTLQTGIANTQSSVRRSYDIITWDNYFDSKKKVDIPSGNSFTVYVKGDEGPLLVFLHGGGYSGLTWSLLVRDLCKSVRCTCVAIDLRGHGESVVRGDDFSLPSMSRDVMHVLECEFGSTSAPLVVIGHSMGGAVAVELVYGDYLQNVAAVVVIDVVEGSALEALGSMKSLLKSRPTSFPSMEAAIQWSVRSGQTRNLEAARVSMSGQIVRADSNDLSTCPEPARSDVIAEVDESVEDATPENQCVSEASQTITGSSSYVWRADLLSTEPYWSDWFRDLSRKFLDCPAAKLLLLAGMDRLDKDLTIGQMQGKFQLELVPRSGHAVQEDAPASLASILSVFLIRHKLAQPTTKT